MPFHTGHTISPTPVTLLTRLSPSPSTAHSGFVTFSLCPGWLHRVPSYFPRDNLPDLSLTLGASLPIVRHSAFITIFPDIALLCGNPITDKLKSDLFTHIRNQHFIIVLVILHDANKEFKTIVKLRANTEF